MVLNTENRQRFVPQALDRMIVEIDVRYLHVRRQRVRIDGKSYGADGKENGKPLSLQTDDMGTVKVSFKLPTAIEKGEGSLSVRFQVR